MCLIDRRPLQQLRYAQKSLCSRRSIGQQTGDTARSWQSVLHVFITRAALPSSLGSLHMGAFKAPSWESQPCRTASLEVPPVLTPEYHFPHRNASLLLSFSCTFALELLSLPASAFAPDVGTATLDVGCAHKYGARLSAQVHKSSAGQHDTIPVDTAPHYVLGKDEGACDIVLPDSSCSREHAALVHHEDGRLFVIDLGSVRATLTLLVLRSSDPQHAHCLRTSRTVAGEGGDSFRYALWPWVFSMH